MPRRAGRIGISQPQDLCLKLSRETERRALHEKWAEAQEHGEVPQADVFETDGICRVEERKRRASCTNDWYRPSNSQSKIQRSKNSGRKAPQRESSDIFRCESILH